LPDCRAYELVTPAYKEGTYISAVLAISRDGSSLVGSSLGVFSGVGGDGVGNGTRFLGAAYEFSRTTKPVGWEATPLDPPRSKFASNGLFDASADLSATLWELGRHMIATLGAPPEVPPCPAKEGEENLQPEGVTDFYIERPRGTFTRIGPATPDPCLPNGNKYTYIGGSADLSHILFSAIDGFRWPLDETAGAGSTLYEYVGTESKSPTESTGPSLVGLGNDRRLISDCGTRLGSSTPDEENGSFGSMYNAISASGDRIFFTAVGDDDQPCGATQPSVDELFAREETPPSESRYTPGEMRTVPISCREGLPAPCADANFEGASYDGSKVFFTSTQKLLPGASEDNTPGDSAVGVGLPPHEERGCVRTAEGSSGCNLYEDELSGSGPDLTQKLVLVSGGSVDPRVQGVARISEDGSHVYFVAKGVLTSVPNNVGSTATEGLDNLYVFSAGHISFIATLSSADNQPEAGEGDWARADNRQVQASWEGRFLVFISVADLTREDVTPGIRQVFQYDAGTGSLARASIGEEGYADDNRTPVDGATIAVRPSGYIYDNTDSPTQANGVLAPENGAVFFESPDALTPQALNDGLDTLGQPVPNVYEYNAGRVYLISDGRDESTVQSGPGVGLIGSDLSGEDVFFKTSDSLIGQDTDSQQDIYDARIDGGIPTAPTAPTCEGEGCRGALGATPGLPAPASTLQLPEAGVLAPLPTPAPLAKPKPKSRSKRCRKGTTPKHGKCIKQKAEKSTHGRRSR
jgi:hypothetical protein